MLALHCCIETSGPSCLHTCVWDCENNNNSGDDDAFYKHFQRLPYEMKQYCLSFCGFHLLANTELWLQNDFLRDHHITASCGATVYDLNRSHIRLHVRHRLNTTPAPNEDQLLLDKHFGSVNRYVSSYYRRCPHFADNDPVKAATFTNEEISNRCQRLQEYTGSSQAIDKVVATATTAFQGMSMTNTTYCGWETTLQHREARSHRNCNRNHNDIILKLDPGLYYWELLNYNWEEMVSAIEGHYKSRQKHFLLDSAPRFVEADGRKRRRIYISLMYRRVCHPDAEKNDRYTTVTYFQHISPLQKQRYTRIFFDFDFDSRSSRRKMCKCIQKPIYQHELTPDFAVHVNQHQRKGSEEICYYSINVPQEATLHSLDRNKNTVRLNFYLEMDTYSFYKKLYGDSIVRALCSNVNGDGGRYLFVPLRHSGIFYATDDDEEEDKRVKIVDLLFYTTVP